MRTRATGTERSVREVPPDHRTAAESKKDEKEWHVEERTYGSFYRSMSLPFEPEDGAVEAHFDKGVLHLTIKKPAKAVKAAKTIDIKTGTPPKKA